MPDRNCDYRAGGDAVIDYREAAYFDGNHCQHVAAWEEVRRLRGIQREMARIVRSMTR